MTFSDFIRNATPEEKEAIYAEVMERATARQNAAAQAPQSETAPNEVTAPRLWLEEARCPECDGSGFTVSAGHPPEQTQCQWCFTKHMILGEATPSASRYILPPLDANGKRPRLFYWEETESCWCPAEGLEVDNIISVDTFISDGDVEKISFKRQDMTDAEFDAIPEV